MGLCVWNIDSSIRPTLSSTGRRSGLGVPKPAKPCTSIPGAPSPPSDKRRKEMNGGPVGDLRSSLHIIIPKGKAMRGGPLASAHRFPSYQKEELTTNAFSRIRRQFLPSPPARPFSALPGRAPLARSLSALPGRALLASGVRVPDLPHEFLKLRTAFLRHLLRHEHVGAMKLKTGIRKSICP